MEDYGFEYSDEEPEEQDVDIENQYYNSKGAVIIWFQCYFFIIIIIWRIVSRVLCLLALYCNSVCELLYLSVVLIFSFVLSEARRVFFLSCAAFACVIVGWYLYR